MTATQFILATGNAIFGVGDTPEAAYAHGIQFGEFAPLADLPRREQSDGTAYIGRASLALVERALSGIPDCARVNIDGIEYTEEEAESIEQ